MASSYSTDLKLELMVTGENAGTWGDKTNTNLNLIQQAVAGYEAVTITDSATTALVMSNAALSNARNMVIKIASITLTGATTVTIPNGIEKFYIFDCSAITGPTNLTIKTASGTGFTLDQAKIYAAYSDGTNLNEISLDTLGGTVAAANISGTIATAQIADNAITTAKISALQVTGAKIAQSTITASKLATDSVGPDQLISTGVTAGSYTTANITVDADGRITAASSGAGGDGGYIYADGGLSGGQTYTANPTATGVLVYGVGGGGGAGLSQQPSNCAGYGGTGGFGIYKAPITPPYSACFTVGAGGNAGTQSGPADGCTGGSTTFGPAPAPLLVVTGGTGSFYDSGQVCKTAQSGTMPTGTINLSIPLPAPYIACPDQGATRTFATRKITGFTLGPTTVGCGGACTPQNGNAGGAGLVTIYELIP